MHLHSLPLELYIEILYLLSYTDILKLKCSSRHLYQLVQTVSHLYDPKLHNALYIAPPGTTDNLDDRPLPWKIEAYLVSKYPSLSANELRQKAIKLYGNSMIWPQFRSDKGKYIHPFFRNEINYFYDIHLSRRFNPGEGTVFALRHRHMKRAGPFNIGPPGCVKLPRNLDFMKIEYASAPACTLMEFHLCYKNGIKEVLKIQDKNGIMLMSLCEMVVKYGGENKAMKALQRYMIERYDLGNLMEQG